MSIHNMARHSGQCGQPATRQHRFRAPLRRDPNLAGPTQLVRPVLGQDRLPVRPVHEPRHLYHRRLRIKPDRMQWPERQATCHAGRVHGGPRWARLL
ncbi:unnamed protein product [Linum tenue]|uniref:Uncharacterized protein n=1 Tax=Linum tenue TaxID=586396 RepID=A0AAV0HDU0_9ROSI|nr:unnamed protein product [Linum tenue]